VLPFPLHLVNPKRIAAAHSTCKTEGERWYLAPAWSVTLGQLFYQLRLDVYTGAKQAASVGPICRAPISTPMRACCSAAVGPRSQCYETRTHLHGFANANQVEPYHSEAGSDAVSGGSSPGSSISSRRMRLAAAASSAAATAAAAAGCASSASTCVRGVGLQDGWRVHAFLSLHALLSNPPQTSQPPTTTPTPSLHPIHQPYQPPADASVPPALLQRRSHAPHLPLNAAAASTCAAAAAAAHHQHQRQRHGQQPLAADPAASSL